jgi:P-type conjugative transfer protein TrbJ
MTASDASAQLAVFDAASYGQAIRQVASDIQQIKALQAGLAQQAAMIVALKSDATAPVLQTNALIASVLKAAGGVGFSSGNVAQAFSATYPAPVAAAAAGALGSHLQAWSQLSRGSLQDALAAETAAATAQPGISQALSQTRDASQAAAGQTSAIQATNQLLTVIASQLSQLQTVLMASARSTEASRAEQQAVAGQAPEESQRALQFTASPSRLQNAGHL